MNEFPEVLCWCLIATMATFIAVVRGTHFSLLFLQRSAASPLRLQCARAAKISRSVIGTKGRWGISVRLSPSALAPEGYPHVFRTKPDHLAVVERRDRHERMFAEASDCRYRTKSIANIERLSSSMAGFGPILSKNYVVTHGS